jgi:hypothetical protein
MDTDTAAYLSVSVDAQNGEYSNAFAGTDNAELGAMILILVRRSRVRRRPLSHRVYRAFLIFRIHVFFFSAKGKRAQEHQAEITGTRPGFSSLHMLRFQVHQKFFRRALFLGSFFLQDCRTETFEHSAGRYVETCLHIDIVGSSKLVARISA